MRDADAVLEPEVPGLSLLSRGKVRDIYAVDDEHLLIVASDRLSAFDVVLPDPIPGKGAVLTALTRFWLARLAGIVPSHATGLVIEDVIASEEARRALAPRSMVVRRLEPLPIEAIARGYLAGSGYKDYLATGAVCGISLPPGLEQADALPQTLFTPSTKAAPGEHDENVSFDEAVRRIGAHAAREVRDASMRLYEAAAAHARECGIIIADTKFEFALDAAGALVLIDEVLTPDSSRFWPVDGYRAGTSPPSFDKQFVRDYLESAGWDKRPPAPRLPAGIVERTARKYREAQRRLTGG